MPRRYNSVPCATGNSLAAHAAGWLTDWLSGLRAGSLLGVPRRWQAGWVAHIAVSELASFLFGWSVAWLAGVEACCLGGRAAQKSAPLSELIVQWSCSADWLVDKLLRGLAGCDTVIAAKRLTYALSPH